MLVHVGLLHDGHRRRCAIGEYAHPVMGQVGIGGMLEVLRQLDLCLHASDVACRRVRPIHLQRLIIFCIQRLHLAVSFELLLEQLLMALQMILLFLVTSETMVGREGNHSRS